MKLGIHLKSLYRSPLKTILTLLLLAAAAFLFLYNLSEYTVADREYREARDKYEGVLTVEEHPVPDTSGSLEFFLLTDETGRIGNYGTALTEGDLELTYKNYHQKSLEEELIEKLGSLPHISRVERRYLTAGVSPDYPRLDTDLTYYPYNYRSVLTATVKSRFFSSVHDTEPWKTFSKMFDSLESVEWLELEDVELLAGNPDWLMDPALKKPYEEHVMYLQTVKEEYQDTEMKTLVLKIERSKYARLAMQTTENHVFPEMGAILQPGHRYLLVLRNNGVDEHVKPMEKYEHVYPTGFFHEFEVGDDSLLGWWPYFVDITDLPENWLETDEFADLRELIRVTNDDAHTFDVVYCDDMAAQRRAADKRIVCEDGRFITPADAGQPVCVVNEDLLKTYGLAVGDTLTLDLGNYLSEQYAPLGAVAVTRGRQNTEFTRQTFTIIGSWRDLNEGSHPYRDRYWSWSNNAIFVPTAFLPECRNAQGHTFKPGEVSFVVGNAEEISAFVEKCIPLVESMGLNYQFSDAGWLDVAKDLMRARSLALVKLLIFTGAAVFALVLTVWLFIGRKKREYGILRALGMGQGEASNRLLIPFLLLGTLAAALGLLVARIVTVYQLTHSAGAHVSADLGLFLLGGLGFLALLAVLALAGLLSIRRESILELTQEKQK